MRLAEAPQRRRRWLGAVALVLALASVALAPASASEAATVGFYRVKPAPIAAPDSLHPHQRLRVVLNILDAQGHPVPRAVSNLSFTPSPGGGSMSAGGVALTPTSRAVRSDRDGRISLEYTTPPTLPRTGTDRFYAWDPAIPEIATSDTYSF